MLEYKIMNFPTSLTSTTGQLFLDIYTLWYFPEKGVNL